MVLNARLVLPVALGVSIAAVTAYVVYYILKKDEDEEQTSERSNIKTSRVNVIEVSVPKSIVPALIGRSGSNIKEIERKTGASIHFKKFNDKDHDVCVLRGKTENTQLAESLIHEFINNQPVIEEDCIMVPPWACGRIIGTGGENINDISHRSGARVKVEGDKFGDSASLRQVSFRGTRPQILAAKDLVEKCVAQEKCRREIEASRRSPRHTSSDLSTPTSPIATNDTSAAAGAGDNTTQRLARPRTAESTGASIEVYVSAVSSPSRFWVQFVGPQVAQLDKLVDEMTDYYNNKDNRALHTLSQVSVGQVVAAVFRHDGRWYRARVADLRPNDFDKGKTVADCFFLDYGDSEYVTVSELCELRADLLRLRFQAMECFLAGVVPAGGEEQTVGVTPSGQRWDKWHPTAITRFEELTQVARWKSLVSKTCTYRKTISVASGEEKEKEIPGIKLFDISDEGEIDIGAELITEGWALAAPAQSPRSSPPAPLRPSAPSTPFGDLGASRVLGMLNEREERSSSVPKEHGRMSPAPPPQTQAFGEKTISQPNLLDNKSTKPHLNGSHDAFLAAERFHGEPHNINASTEDLENKHHLSSELKANMNRIDSHHSNLDTLARMQPNELHKLG